MFTSLNIFLQAAAGSAGMSFWIMIIAIFAIMYFFMIRPQRKRQKEIEKFRNSLNVGDEVITSGGILGTIHEINPAENVVILEVAKGVFIRIDKSCIFAKNSLDRQMR